MNKHLPLIAMLSATFAFPCFADTETDELRQEVKALEARIAALEHKEAQQQAQLNAQSKQLSAQAQQPAPVQQAQAAPAGGNLEQRVTVLEQQTAKNTADTTAMKDDAPAVKYEMGRGVTVASQDGSKQIRIGGYFQADNHTFLGDTVPNNNDQFYIRSARPILEAKYDNFSARLMMDFGNGTTQLLDAYADYNAAQAFNLRVGKFKDPVGLERWQSEDNVLFVERGMTTNLVPYRDNGVGIYGQIIPNALEYQVAFTNGSPDLVNGTNGVDNDQTVTARLFAHPFVDTAMDYLKGFAIGAAGSYGSHNDSLTSTDLTSGYVTPGQSKFFTYATTAYASGEQWRFNPQAMYYNGPFSMLGEYVVEDQELKDGALDRVLQNNAWMVTMTYVLTGEDASFSGVVPRENFDPFHDQWGAFEFVARLSRLRVDEDAFPVFASPSVSAREAFEHTIGGTWYMNPAVKLNLDLAYTTFEGGEPAGGNRPDELAILSRAQVKF